MKWPNMVDAAERAEQRRKVAIAIVGHAITAGLDANLPMVLRNYHLWFEWHQGRYNTGYLMRRTGVKGIRNDTVS